MQEYLHLAKSIAIESGDIMKKYFLETDRVWKDDATPLTIADTEINTLVLDRIQEHYPDHSIHGEEESHYKNSEYMWVCDPIDGTLPYSSGIPASTFSLALVINGVPEIGVVYDPFNNRLFYASKNRGAFMNDKPIHVSSRSTLNNAIIDIEGLHSPEGKYEIPLSNVLRDKLIDKGAKPTQFWSCILPSVLVAYGTFTAVIMNGRAVHDGAAVKIIVEEAGGKVTDMNGKYQTYDGPIRGFIASNGLVHDELVQIISNNLLN